METIFKKKPFLLVEDIPFNGSHSFKWKFFVLVEAIPFKGSHTCGESHSFFAEIILYNEKILLYGKSCTFQRTIIHHFLLDNVISR